MFQLVILDVLYIQWACRKRVLINTMHATSLYVHDLLTLMHTCTRSRVDLYAPRTWATAPATIKAARANMVAAFMEKVVDREQQWDGVRMYDDLDMRR